MNTETLASTTTLNGWNPEALRQMVGDILEEPARGQTQWRVATQWKGGAQSETRVTASRLGGQELVKNFRIGIDEPVELGGTNAYPNPQEVLFAALNACMTVGFVAQCALAGITLESLRIETEGDIDLRGFLGIDPLVKPGYDEIRYTVHVTGDAPPEEFERIHRIVTETSPNYFNIRCPVPLRSRLVVR